MWGFLKRMWRMDWKQTIQWIITALLRLVAGYLAIKFGKDAVDQDTLGALGNGLAAAAIAGISIYTSIKARKKLLATPPPEK